MIKLNFKLIYVYFSLFVYVLINNAFAIDLNPENILAKVTKYDGRVSYHQNNAVRGEDITKIDFPVYVNDNVRTKSNARADLTLVDDSKIILTERSSIRFDGIKQVSAEQGIVLFDVKQQAQLNGFKVKSAVAVIGVKGTQFIVDSNADKIKVYMKEGLVSIESISGEFKRYQQSEKAAFDNYKQDMKQEFDTFKQKSNAEFIEFVKSFEVGAGKAISIDGTEVHDIVIPDDIQKYFVLFDEK